MPGVSSLNLATADVGYLSRAFEIYYGEKKSAAALDRFAAGGDPSNLLPTGLYTSYVWRHKKLRPALRMSTGAPVPT